MKSRMDGDGHQYDPCVALLRCGGGGDGDDDDKTTTARGLHPWDLPTTTTTTTTAAPKQIFIRGQKTTTTPLLLLLVVVAVLSIPNLSEAAPAPQQQDEHDNVLFILLDQLRYDALGFVQRGLSKYKNKVTVRTPNIDALAANGVSFANAYSQSMVCGPCRATIKTGRTVAHHGIVSNSPTEPRVYNLLEAFRKRITNLTTFEQVLRYNHSYSVETYGKWHFPVMYYDPITYNDYRYLTQSFDLQGDAQFFIGTLYMQDLKDLQSLNVLGPAVWKSGDQAAAASGGLYPYTPLPTDPMFGQPTKSSQTVLPAWLRGVQLGIDSLSSNYTTSGILGNIALKALDRLMKAQATNAEPFLLSVHFNAPHPPHVVTNSFLQYYRQNRAQLFSPPSLKDKRVNSPYAGLSKYVNDPRFLTNNATFIADFTSVYYAMVEEVDAQAGNLIKRLQQDPDIYNRTLIVFTSDHGEMLGSHGLTGKGNLYEESIRVPIILAHPTKITPGQVVKNPVTQLDMLATILDYSVGLVDASQAPGDGVSLRRFVDKSNYNQDFDERAIVVEADPRVPVSNKALAGTLGAVPNFMIRRGPYKLLLPRNATGAAVDALWNLNTDPYETNNLLKSLPNGPVVLGKAEHLKILLVEWLLRHDTDIHVYTSNYYHLGKGRGDVTEVLNRRTWKKLNFWVSDTTLGFGTPAKISDTEYRRNEYLYVGGQVSITGATMEGSDAALFTCALASPLIGSSAMPYVRIQVQFVSTVAIANMSSLQATVVIQNNVTGTTRIPIVGDE